MEPDLSQCPTRITFETKFYQIIEATVPIRFSDSTNLEIHLVVTPDNGKQKYKVESHNL